MPGRQPLPNGTVLAGDIRVVGLIDDGALGYVYSVEKGPQKDRAQLIEFCPRTIAARAPDGAVFAATPEAAELIKVCLARFLRDAETLRSARHPNLQPVLDLLAANGTAYALQPAEQNRSLAAVANSLQRPPTQDEVDKIVRPLIPALAGLHARRLFHANISPETILVGSGIEPLLVRFGGTQAFVAARTRTVHAAVTPGYSAPELYLFDESGHGPTCDVFSLAATLYRVVTGRTPADVIQRSLGEAVAPASRTQGSYRPRFLQAIDAGMALDPKARPQTIEAFGALLLGIEPASPRATSAPPQVPTPRPQPAPGQAANSSPLPNSTAAVNVSPPVAVAGPAPDSVAKTPATSKPAEPAPGPKPPQGEDKPRLTVVPKSDTATTSREGSGASAQANGKPRSLEPPAMPRDLGALLPGSYRLVALGVALAGLLGGGMWLLDRQLRDVPSRGAAPPAPIAQKAAPTVATTPQAAKPTEPPEQKAADLERKAAEDRIAAERAAAERKITEERRAAEEREAAEKQRSEEIERQKEQQRADEAARAAEAARQQKARLTAIAAAMDRETLLALQSDDTALNTAIEQRLAQLGYLHIITATGDKWLRPGDGEPFRDCDGCPEMVLVPPPVRVSTAAAKPAAPANADTSVRSVPSAAMAVGRYEVTRDEFAAFVADTGYDTSGGCHARIPDWKLDPQLSWQSPGFAQDGRHPVVCVSFDDARAYAAWLSQQAKQPYRLPTEPEWEHAARSNTATVLRFPFGNDEREICKFANGADESARQAYPGWQVSACSDGFTHTSPAGTFKPNHFGLYDTMGNAWEWVDECAPPPSADGVVRKADCTATSPRILKGGSYSDRPELLEPQSRSGAEPHVRDEIAGFRIVRGVEVRPVAGSVQK